jgi:hypothetical protein
MQFADGLMIAQIEVIDEEKKESSYRVSTPLKQLLSSWVWCEIEEGGWQI